MINNTLKNKLLFYLLLMTFSMVGCSTILEPSNESPNKEDALTPVEKSQPKGSFFMTRVKFETSKPRDCWNKPKKDDVFILAMGSNTDGLEYTHNDAKKFAKAMGDLFKVHKDQVCILENVSKSEFTQALERLSEDNLVEAGDLVIIYFSGHGTQCREDDQNEEKDCKDEAFVVSPKGYEETEIKDDDFAILMKDIHKKTRYILTVIDACFSAGLNKSREEISHERVKYSKNSNNLSSECQWFAGCAPPHIDVDLDSTQGILLSAATEDQKAVEIHDKCNKTDTEEKDTDIKSGGLFTNYWLKTLKEQVKEREQKGTRVDLSKVFKLTSDRVETYSRKCFSDGKIQQPKQLGEDKLLQEISRRIP